MAEEKERVSEGASTPSLRDKREENEDATQPSHNMLNGKHNKAPAPHPTSTSWKKTLIVIVAILVFLVLLAILIWFFASKKPPVPAPATAPISTPTTSQQTTAEKNIRNSEDVWRVYGGRDATKDEWPWRVLITRKSGSMSETLRDSDNIVGGGSIIHKAWILTAAHVLDHNDVDKFAVFVGVSERPDEDESVMSSVEAYAIGEYFRHPNFSKLEFNNDIALIKLGAKLDSNMREVEGSNHGLTFKTSIKPVCLPCTETCTNLLYLNKGFVGGDSQATNETSDKAKCENEETYLLSSQKTVVVTGFSHVPMSDEVWHKFNPSKNLQEAPLKIEDQRTCKEGIEKIKDLKKKESLKYTESMICYSPRVPEKEFDACLGDSGGPIVESVRYYVKDDNINVQEWFWVQVGIVSFGIGCGRTGTLGYHTNVANFIPWINSTTNGIFQGPALDLTVVSVRDNAMSSKVQVSWKLSEAYDYINPQRIKEYSLYYSVEESSIWSHIMISDGANTTAISGLLLNKVYRYMIKAMMTEGITLPPSRVVYHKSGKWPDCEDGDIYYGGYCFWFDTTRRTFAASQAECESRHSTTGYVINSNHYDIIMDKIREAIPSDTNEWWFWIGLRCNPSTGAVTTISDTQKTPFVKWRYSQPTHMARKTNIYLQVEKDASSAYNGMENSYDFYKAGVICQYKSL